MLYPARCRVPKTYIFLSRTVHRSKIHVSLMYFDVCVRNYGWAWLTCSPDPGAWCQQAARRVRILCAFSCQLVIVEVNRVEVGYGIRYSHSKCLDTITVGVHLDSGACRVLRLFIWDCAAWVIGGRYKEIGYVPIVPMMFVPVDQACLPPRSL